MMKAYIVIVIAAFMSASSTAGLFDAVKNVASGVAGMGRSCQASLPSGASCGDATVGDSPYCQRHKCQLCNGLVWADGVCRNCQGKKETNYKIVGKTNPQARRKNRVQNDSTLSRDLTIQGHKLGESAAIAFQTNATVHLEGFDAFKTMELSYGLYEGKLYGMRFVSERCQARGDIQKLIQYIGEHFFNNAGLTKSTTRMKDGDISYEISMKACSDNKKEGYVTINLRNEFLRKIDDVYATEEGIPCRISNLCGAISYDEQNEIYVIKRANRGRLSEGPRKKPEELNEVTVIPPENWEAIEKACKAGNVEPQVNYLWKVVKKYQDLKYGLLSANYLISYYKSKDDIASADRVVSSICGMRRTALAKSKADAKEKARKEKADKEAKEYELKEKAIADAMANPQTDTGNEVYECLTKNSKKTQSWQKSAYAEMRGRAVAWKGKVVDVVQGIVQTKSSDEIMSDAQRMQEIMSVAQLMQETQQNRIIPQGLCKISFNEIYEQCKKDSMVKVATLIVDMGSTDVAVNTTFPTYETIRLTA